MNLQELKKNAGFYINVSENFGNINLINGIQELKNQSEIDLSIYLSVTIYKPISMNFTIYFDLVKVSERFKTGANELIGERICEHTLSYEPEWRSGKACRNTYINGFFDKRFIVKKLSDVKLYGPGCYNILAYCIPEENGDLSDIIVSGEEQYPISAEAILDGWSFEVTP